jgi:hypothetical protein
VDGDFGTWFADKNLKAFSGTARLLNVALMAYSVF